MIDPVALKALVERIDSDAVAVEDRVLAYTSFREDFAPLDLARQVLALSDEVERIREQTLQACREQVDASLAIATAAESEAQTLRERMGEIREIALQSVEENNPRGALDRIMRASDTLAALSTTPKEKEG